MKLTFCSLNSGSNGNATYVEAGQTRLLVDAGLPGRSLTAKLAQIKVLPETLSGILITHEHSDHITGAGVLSRKYHLPIYANEATWQTRAMQRLVGEVAPGLRRVFETESDFYIGDIGIFPVGIPHDAAEPVAYRLFSGSRSVAVATDMGRVPKKVLGYLMGVDLVLLESNHDPEMLLHNERYPLHLKQRIMGGQGHLSNLQSAQTLMKLYASGVKHAVLGHLSSDNNTPELALSTVRDALQQEGLNPDVDIRLDMAWRDKVGGLYTIE